MGTPTFVQLNVGWNAEPNAPDPRITVDSSDLVLSFYMNPFRYKEFKNDELGFLRFVDCSRYRLGSTNDEGWYMGQCRFSKVAPSWGEFYELRGDPASTEGRTDWRVINPESKATRHFLFYFRDDTFECVATSCVIEPREDNALKRTSKTLHLSV